MKKIAGRGNRVAEAFFSHKMGVAGMWVLIVMYAGALFADFLSPYDYRASRDNAVFTPPTGIHFRHEGRFAGPFVYGVIKKRNPDTFKLEYAPDTSTLYPIRLLAHGDPYRLLGIIPSDVHLFGLGPTDQAVLYLMGGDKFGRDLFSRILSGSRVSLTAGIIGTLISVVIGALIGALSGFYGGLLDTLIQRFIEILRSFPRIPLWLALAMIIPPAWPSTALYMGIVIVLSFIGWMGVARVVRGMSLSLREKQFVLAARAFGQKPIRVITRHLIPNTMGYLIVVATLSIPGMILGESTISFLGLGIKEPMTSWGLLLKEAQAIGAIQSHAWLLLPGVFIMLAVLSFNFVGDALRDALDPYGAVGKAQR